MDIKEFVARHGSHGFTALVRRAISHPNWSPREWDDFEGMLVDLEEAFTEVARSLPCS